MGILIKNICAVLPGQTPEAEFVPTVTDVYLENDRIAGIGQAPAGFTADRVLDGTDRLLTPGLVNAHTHSYMAFMRNCADDLSFMDWLFGRVDPIEQKMTDEDAYWGACLAILEMMKTGTTCFNDMQMNIHQTTRAVKESGMRAVICRGLVGSGNDEAGQTRLRQAYEERDAFRDCDRLSFRLGPHAPYTCDEAFLRIVAEEAKREGMGIHMHLSESVTEIENCKKDYGCSPIELAQRCGLFDVPFIAAHCVQVTDADLEILKKHNVSVVTNPASNMKLGNGFAPVPEMLEKGINVCIGTDGAASNNSLNLIHEMSLVTLIHKGTHRDPQCVSAVDAFRFATIGGARGLGLEDRIGSIEVGKKADLAIFRLKTPSMWPVNNPIAALSYSANGTEAETVIIDGRVTMENGRVLTLDEERILKETEKIMKRIGNR
ncbi:MAG: amidohydrolase [Lachnospiraceae bacterium]|nr:amidohydrolase [Lachnospiraceae bacterium]